MVAWEGSAFYSAGTCTPPSVWSWFTRGSAADNNWYGVCWSPELALLCAVANTGSGNRVMTSPDGITWTTRTPANGNQWSSVCWSSALGLFCATAFSGTGNRVMTSPDGINWTERTTPVDNSWNSICWSPDLSLFCAVALTGTGNRVMTSPDGINWTARTSAADNMWRSVCWAGGPVNLFCAVANSGSGNRVMTSPDGINWTSRAASTDINWYSVCWSPDLSLFCATPNTISSSNMMTSPDGINWTSRPTSAGAASVCWAPEIGLFCGVQLVTPNNRVVTSPDGINWTVRTSAADNVWRSVCWSAALGMFVAVSDSGAGNRVMTGTLSVAPGLGLLAFCANRLGVTFPSTPAGWRIVASVSDGVAGIAIIVFARRALGSGDAFAFPSDCTHVTIGAWSGLDAAVAGAANIATSGGVAQSPVTYPAIPALKTRTPWVAEFSFNTNTVATPAAAPAGMTRRASNATAAPSGSSVVDDTNATVTAFTAKTAALAPTAPWLSAAIELIPTGSPNIQVLERVSQEAALLAYQAGASERVSQEAALVVYGPPAAKKVEVSQMAALTPYDLGIYATPRVSQMFAMVVYSEAVPDERRNRCWAFVFDGHTFYVLDLGIEGTWVYDIDTKQWCKFTTQGYGNSWNMKGGATWQDGRVVACDSANGWVWEIVPTQPLDETWRTIVHASSAGIPWRSRAYVAMEALRITASVGVLGEDGANFNLRFSDDNGKTWSATYTLTLTEGDFGGELAWRSLGSFMSPGRVIELTDDGGLIRIDGADVFINNYDGEGNG